MPIFCENPLWSLGQNYAQFFMRLPYCHSLGRNYAHFFVRPPLWPLGQNYARFFVNVPGPCYELGQDYAHFFFEVISRSHRERHCMCRSGSVNCYISSSSCYKKQISKTSGKFPRNLKSIFPWLFSLIFELRFKPGVQPTSELKSIALYTKTAVFNITLK